MTDTAAGHKQWTEIKRERADAMVMNILLQGLKKPKVGRLGLYCCNDADCRREQNRTYRLIRKARKHQVRYGTKSQLDWYFLDPAQGVKPAFRGRRHGW